MKLPLERRFRDLRVGRIYEGVDEVNPVLRVNLFKRNAVPRGAFDDI
jgi:hypothetical protein